MRGFIGSVVLVVLAVPLRADVTDVAELFPAETLAYAEVAHPAQLAEETAKLLAKSAFAASLKAVHDRFDKLDQPHDAASVQRAAMLALVFSPEMLAEVKKFRGMAVGVTGFDARLGPRYAGVVLFGDSTAAGLAVRGYLTTTPNIRRVGVVEGTPVFQHAGFAGAVVGPDGKPLPAEEGAGGATVKPLAAEGVPTIAYRPGLLVVGSDVSMVKETLRRAYGSGGMRSLATEESFRAKRPREKFSGAFVYGTPRAIAKSVEGAAKKLDPIGLPEWLEFARVAFDWKSFPAMSGTVTLRGDSVRFAADLDVQPSSAANPAVAMVSGPPIAETDVQATPKNTGWATTLALPAKETRSKAILELADTFAKSVGHLGRKPSEIVADAERESGPKRGAELLPGVRSVSLVQVAGQKLPADAQAMPVVVLHCESPSLAEAWIENGVRVLGLIAGLEKLPTRSSEQVGDVRVYSVPGSGLPGNAAIHFARLGDRVAFGQDRLTVAEVLANKGVVERRPASMEKACWQGWVRPASLFPEAKPLLKDAAAPPRAEGLLPPNPLPGVPFQIEPNLLPRLPEPLVLGLARAFNSVPPVPFSVGSSAGGLQFQLEVPDPSTTWSEAVDRFFDWFAKQPVPNERPGRLWLDR